MYRAAAVGFVDGAAHAVRNRIGVHDHPPVRVTRRSADRLDKRGIAAQKALFIGVQNRHQPHFRHIQPLAEQVDAAKHVELARTQAVYDVYAFQRIHVAVHVSHFDAVLL